MRLRQDRRDTRRKQAKERQVRYDALSPEDRMKRLDERGLRAVRERARIANQINAQQPKAKKAKKGKEG